MTALEYNFSFLERLLPESISKVVASLPADIKGTMEEIRIRKKGPLQVRWDRGDGWVTPDGTITHDNDMAYKVTEKDLYQAIQALTRNSLYALEEELRSGYITICGGHRVGLTGEAVVSRGEILTIKNFAGINLRLARSVKECARDIIPYLVEGGKPKHTIIISPPRCGKTTLLRDIIRLFSSGMTEISFPGVNVGLVDERSEIAGCYQGVPQLDVGPRTDVLDRCPKAEGMLMLLRSMGPDVVATDEIGKPNELMTLQDILNAGVTVVSTVHAGSLDDLKNRPAWKELLDHGFWQRIIIMGRSLGPGTVEALYRGDGRILRRGPWRRKMKAC